VAIQVASYFQYRGVPLSDLPEMGSRSLASEIGLSRQSLADVLTKSVGRAGVAVELLLARGESGFAKHDGGGWGGREVTEFPLPEAKC
jgi:hypothetical protein